MDRKGINNIPVTKPFMPPKEEYLELLTGIWDRNWLTNNGPLVNQLESRLKSYLGVNHLLYLSSGTIGLQLAIKSLRLTGEIITTPFSYVATTSSIVWENCSPVFVDINPESLNIDVNQIENSITVKTSAILVTHVFGNPCEIDKIQEIAKRRKLKVIYDAAHSFGVKYKGKSIFKYGDISVTSLHATKLFHTIEGGAIFTKDSNLLKEMAFMRNFGHNGQGEFYGIGINGKNSEFHAAMGLCNLNYIDEILQYRRRQYLLYNQLLSKLRCEFQVINNDTEYNYAYYPIIFESEKITLRMIRELEKFEIYPRRYFYPSLNKLNYVPDASVPVSESITGRIICLPLYHGLSDEEQNMIAEILLRTQNN